MFIGNKVTVSLAPSDEATRPKPSKLSQLAQPVLLALLIGDTMNTYTLTIEDTKTNKRYARVFKAASPQDAMRTAYHVLSTEHNTDYYIIHCVVRE